MSTVMSDATKQLDDLRRELRDTRATLNQVLKMGGRYRTALERIACDPHSHLYGCCFCGADQVAKEALRDPPRLQSEPVVKRVRPQSCPTCHDVGWLCAATGKPADFDTGLCCGPIEDPEFGRLGPSCPSANGCDCGQRP